MEIFVLLSIFNGNSVWYLWPSSLAIFCIHDDVIKWKHFPRYWPFLRGFHRSPVNFPHKGQWRGTLMFSLICAWINGWINNWDAGDLRRHRAHYDITVTNTCAQSVCQCKYIVSQWMNVEFVVKCIQELNGTVILHNRTRNEINRKSWNEKATLEYLLCVHCKRRT